MDLEFAMVAGEASGDLLAAQLLIGMRALMPGLVAFGIGGPHMAAQGFVADWPMERLAVRGYAEVLAHYPEIAMIRRRLRRRILASPPRLFVGVDAPDFNLGLEYQLRRRGVTTVHFVSPSIWAWRGRRIDFIRSAVDHMLVVFPFEEDIYRNAGVAVTYVGHPLADVITQSPDREAARRRLELPPGVPVVALLPGSRISEVHAMAPRFFAAAQLLARRVPEVVFAVPTATPLTQMRISQMASKYGRDLRLHVYAGRSHEVLAACDAALVASGTATLEAALFKRPMVIAYVMNRLSWIMMKRLRYLPWVGLPNILSQEFLVPEFLQDNATPTKLADAIHVQLSDADNRNRLMTRFSQMHATLRRGTAARAAHVITGLMERT